MKPKLKNYSTTIPAERSISEIQTLLVKFGASNIMLETNDGLIVGIKFTYRIDDRLLPFRLPVNLEKTTDALWHDYQESRTRGRKKRDDFIEESHRISWRIARDWIHAQLSILYIEAARFEEVFLGYLMMDNRHTLTEKIMSGDMKKLLPEFREN